MSTGFPPLSISNPDMSGMMTIPQKSGLFRKKKDLQNFYILKDSDLFYFENKGDEAPLGFFLLDGVVLKKGKDGTNSFDLEFPDEDTITFTVAKGREMTNWMLALQNGIDASKRSQNSWYGKGYPLDKTSNENAEESSEGMSSSGGGGVSAAEMALRRRSRLPKALIDKQRMEDELDVLSTFGGLIDMDGSGRASSAAAGGLVFDPLAMAMGDQWNTSGAVPSNAEIKEIKRSATELPARSKPSMEKSVSMNEASLTGSNGGDSSSSSSSPSTKTPPKPFVKSKSFAKRATSLLQRSGSKKNIVFQEETTRDYSTTGKFPPVTFDKPDLGGFLNKEGGNVKNIKKRWFALKDSDLFYFKSEEDNVPLGFIMVDKCRLFKPQRKWSRSHGFALENTKGRTYYVFAKDQEEMTEWMLALENARLRGRRSMTHWDVPGYTDE
eukprot:TRINITY_DN2351_c0_g1_i2.p1 TRINITY_DN2351_c0_g1~~TRINITY_DN2351_c0_g1_i2.p1  ORF type:complete len:439 (+),score=155.71 TRINITY_DN2351_c0_g1_i2:956-2272(+)